MSAFLTCTLRLCNSFLKKTDFHLASLARRSVPAILSGNTRYSWLARPTVESCGWQWWWWWRRRGRGRGRRHINGIVRLHVLVHIRINVLLYDSARMDNILNLTRQSDISSNRCRAGHVCLHPGLLHYHLCDSRLHVLLCHRIGDAGAIDWLHWLHYGLHNGLRFQVHS